MPENKAENYDEKFIKQRKSAIICFAVLFLALGVFVAFQTRASYIKSEKEAQGDSSKIQAYKNQLKALEGDVVLLSGEISDLEIEYDSRMEQLASNDTDFFRAIEFYNASIDKYKIYAGASNVTGSGIEISIDDANSSNGVVSQYMLVHDSTLLGIVNALREAGAQAISVNGERIVSDSELLCMGTSIKVNDKKLFAPFTIKAIGDSNALYDSLLASSIYKNIVMADLNVSVVRGDNIHISGYNGITGDSVKYLNDKK